MTCWLLRLEPAPYFVIRNSLFDILRFNTWPALTLLIEDSLLDIGYSSALSRG